MSFFPSEVVTAPAHLPVAASDAALAAAVTEEIERTILWRGIVRQERKITIDGALPSRLELEPIVSITSLTRWTPTDAAAVIDATGYDFVSRDPLGATIFAAPGKAWPAAARDIGSFEIVYQCGWTVEPESSPGANDAVNEVPASVKLMIERAIAFRAGSGVGDIAIGSLKLSVADSYETDRIPPAIADIGRAYQFRPGLFAGRL